MGIQRMYCLLHQLLLLCSFFKRPHFLSVIFSERISERHHFRDNCSRRTVATKAEVESKLTALLRAVIPSTLTYRNMENTKRILYFMGTIYNQIFTIRVL